MSFSKTCSIDSFTYIKELPIEKGFSTFFWYLYKNRICTDVKFILETDYGCKEFQAHRLILSMMSPHFEEKFYKKGKCPKKMEEIFLKKVDPEAFETMLRFIYKGSIPQLDSPKQACGLYKIAVEFKVRSLVEKCNEFLNRTEVEPSDVFTFLEVGEYVKNRSLIDRCLALIQGRTREVMNSYPLSDITASMIHVILNLTYLALASEYELLKWVFTWAELKAGQENSKYKNAREVLQKILPLMHFLQLSNVEFAEICRDYAGFFTSDEIASILLNIAIPNSSAMPEWYDKNHSLRVYPEHNATSNTEQNGVGESCLSQNGHDEKDSKENEKEEAEDQQNKSEEGKLEQNENEETNEQNAIEEIKFEEIEN